MSSANDLAGRVAVITGASSGFGCGAAVEYARHGASVVLAARSENLLADVVRQCESAGGRALAVPTDVADRKAVEQLARRAIDHFGSFDIWINNAGVAALGRFHEVPLEDHLQVIETNLNGCLMGSYVAVKHFRERGNGTLINVASVIGKIPAALYASYTASKFGVVGLSDAIRQELRDEEKTAIHVCTVLPMAHDTTFFEHAANYTGHQAVPIPPTYDPQVTVDKLVALATSPEDEVITGWQGKVFNVLHKLAPGTVERFMTANTTTNQLEKAPPAADTSGIVHRPSGTMSDVARTKGTKPAGSK